MNRGEIAFLLIGLGFGLMFAVAAIVEMMFSWLHHVFIMGFNASVGSVLLATPFLLVIAGSVLLYRDRKRA